MTMGNSLKLRFFRDDLTVLPKIDWGTMHACDLASSFGGASHSSAYACSKTLRFFDLFKLSNSGCHGPCFRFCTFPSHWLILCHW